MRGAAWPTPAHGSTSRNGAKTWARARFTPTKATVCRSSPTRSDQNVASVTGMKAPWSSARLSRRLALGQEVDLADDPEWGHREERPLGDLGGPQLADRLDGRERDREED